MAKYDPFAPGGPVWSSQEHQPYIEPRERGMNMGFAALVAGGGVRVAAGTDR